MAKPLHFLPTDKAHGRLLPWVVGVMVFLAGLAVALAVGLQTLTRDWQVALESSLTVQVVDTDAAAREEAATKVVELLRGMPEVVHAERLSDEALEGLLEPWLGTGDIAEDLPVPVLVEVTLAQASNIDLQDLDRRIRGAVPSARLDSHERWLADLVTVSRVIQLLSAVVVGLIVLATVTVVIFATRASLAAQHETIDIVHLMGAEDKQIAGAFQRRFLLVGIRGGLLGLIGLAVIFIGADTASQMIETAMLPSLVPPIQALYALLVLPLPAALITMFTARFTVKRALAELN